MSVWRAYVEDLLGLDGYARFHLQTERVGCRWSPCSTSLPGEDDTWAFVWAETNIKAGGKAEIWNITSATLIQTPQRTSTALALIYFDLWLTGTCFCWSTTSPFTFLPCLLFFAWMGAVHSGTGQLRLPGKVRGHGRRFDRERRHHCIRVYIYFQLPDEDTWEFVTSQMQADTIGHFCQIEGCPPQLRADAFICQGRWDVGA